MERDDRRALALTWVGTAAAGFRDAAEYLDTVPPSEWNGPTGCSEWTIRDLAGHIVGEAVWFPNLARGITSGEEPYPSSLYGDLKELPNDELTERLRRAAEELVPAIEGATDEQLEMKADLGFTRMPLWRATSISALEGLLHGWDAKAKREPEPRIPREWALALVGPARELGPSFAHHSQIAGAEGTYRLEVDEVGPLTVRARDRRVTIEEGTDGTPDVTLQLTPDRYVRLLSGRLHLDGADGSVPIEGHRDRVAGLLRIFGGIANGD